MQCTFRGGLVVLWAENANAPTSSIVDTYLHYIRPNRIKDGVVQASK